jgi:hypothetical protein
MQLSFEQFVEKWLHSNALTVQILRSWPRNGIGAQCKRIAFAFAVREQSGLFALSVDGDGVHIAEQCINAESTGCHIQGEIDATQSALNKLALRFKVKGEENDSALLFDSKAHALLYHHRWCLMCFCAGDVDACPLAQICPQNMANLGVFASAPSPMCRCAGDVDACPLAPI